MQIITDQEKITELLERGVVEVIDHANLREKLSSGKRLRVKLGIDPTGPLLHLGRSIPLLKLRDFQQLGHQIVLIIGNFTSQIGDTSDKDSERPMLTAEQVQANMVGYLEQMAPLLNLDEVEVRYNDDWLSPLGMKDLVKLADAFSLHEFTQRDVIKRRLDAGKRVNLRELLYPLMQGYDSVAVQADVEIGGTDQRFNMLTGRSLQPLYDQVPQDVIMTPIIDGTDGAKMSTSQGNTVPITAVANDMFGAIMSLRDELIIPYFTYLTRVPLTEIKEDAARLEQGENPRNIKVKLAKALVAFYHDETAAKAAEEHFVTVFSKNEAPSEMTEVTVQAGEHDLASLLVDIQVASSKSEARRLIEQGAVRVDEAVIDQAGEIGVRDGLIINVGKRRWVRLRCSE